MAFGTASGWFVTTMLGQLGAGVTTGVYIDWTLDTHKIAMFNNSITAPNFSTNTAYGVAPFNANEVSGTGYTANGALLTGTTITESPAGTLMFDATDVSWTTSTITDARGALIYADALAGNQAMLLIAFGQGYSTVAGTFAIQFATTGIGTIDLTP